MLTVTKMNAQYDLCALILNFGCSNIMMLVRDFSKWRLTKKLHTTLKCVNARGPPMPAPALDPWLVNIKAKHKLSNHTYFHVLKIPVRILIEDRSELPKLVTFLFKANDSFAVHQRFLNGEHVKKEGICSAYFCLQLHLQFYMNKCVISTLCLHNVH